MFRSSFIEACKKKKKSSRGMLPVVPYLSPLAKFHPVPSRPPLSQLKSLLLVFEIITVETCLDLLPLSSRINCPFKKRRRYKPRKGEKRIQFLFPFNPIFSTSSHHRASGELISRVHKNLSRIRRDSRSRSEFLLVEESTNNPF